VLSAQLLSCFLQYGTDLQKWLKSRGFCSESLCRAAPAPLQHRREINFSIILGRRAPRVPWLKPSRIIGAALWRVVSWRAFGLCWGFQPRSDAGWGRAGGVGFVR